MNRISVEQFNHPSLFDDDVFKSWQWFMSFISIEDWKKRKANIEKSITMNIRKTPPFSEPITNGTLMVIKDDVIGWYLYLVDMFLNEPHKYEYFQGARVIPIFKKFGMDLDLLKKINGIEIRLKDLVKKRQREADSLLFEMLTALLWAKNGYDVAFLVEKNKRKTPDIIAKYGNRVLKIECKRQSKTSDYSYRETVKRQKMLSFLNIELIKYNVLLDIVFHVELESLSDTFLKDLLEKKIQFAVEGKIVSNEQVDIELTFIDIKEVKEKLKTSIVKNNSPMLHALIGNKPVDGFGFTCGMKANFYRVGEGVVNNLFISDIENAYGVYCSCDAQAALNAKARGIGSQVNKAIKQFDSEHTSVIHIGIETLEGAEVEKKRFEKISATMKRINPQDSKLRWIFCNFFQAYSPIDTAWLLDETVSTMSAYYSKKQVLHSKMMIVPDDGDILNGVSHWERLPPF